MVALSLDLKPTVVPQQRESLDVSMSTQLSVPQLDLNLLVMPSLAAISSELAQTIASQVDVDSFTEITPLRAIANDFLSTQVVASVVTNRIAEALEIIVGMEKSNAARDVERSWQEMYGLAALPNSPAVTLARQPVAEYEEQLAASLAA